GPAGGAGRGVPAAACVVGPACAASGARPPAVHAQSPAWLLAPARPPTRRPWPQRPARGGPARRGRRRRAGRTAVSALWLVAPSSSPPRAGAHPCAPLASPTPGASRPPLAPTPLGARRGRPPPSPPGPPGPRPPPGLPPLGHVWPEPLWGPAAGALHQRPQAHRCLSRGPAGGHAPPLSLAPPAVRLARGSPVGRAGLLLRPRGHPQRAAVG